MSCSIEVGCLFFASSRALCIAFLIAVSSFFFFVQIFLCRQLRAVDLQPTDDARFQVRRLRALEERILEQRAWAAESSLWPLQTSVAREKRAQAERDRLASSSTEPVARKRSSSRQKDAKAQFSALELFTRKVLALAAVRIRSLCKSLNLRNSTATAPAEGGAASPSSCAG